MLNDLEAGRDVFQYITLVLPDTAEHSCATARANADRVMGDSFTRKMLRQRLAHRVFALAGTGLAMPGGDGRLGTSLAFARILLEVTNEQFELLDIVIKLLRRLPEPRTPKLGKLHLQLLNMERLRMDVRSVSGNLDVFARQLRLQGLGKGP